MRLLPIFLMSSIVIGCGDKPIDDDGDGFAVENDCDDSSISINPNMTDILGDGIDQNCDGIDGTDADGDGIASLASGGEDCNDEDATEEGSNPKEFWADTDVDGFGDADVVTVECVMPTGFVDNSEDCDDNDADIHPDATEICDGIDNDCDADIDDADDSIDSETQQTWYLDEDGDGFGQTDSSQLACEMPENHVLEDGDCADDNGDIHPAATEILNDGIDNDCDAQELCYLDGDNDGFGSTEYTWIDATSSCLDADNAAENAEDCDDAVAEVNPNAIEICDGVDNDCDADIDDEDANLDTSTAQTFFADNDGDGYGNPNNTVFDCDGIGAVSSNDEDCNDNNPNYHPEALDFVGNNVDENCDNVDGTDTDGDGDASMASGGHDCDDNDPLVDSSTDLDSDGFTCVNDCNDDDATVYPNAGDIPEDGIDQDCSGLDAQYSDFFGDVNIGSEQHMIAFCLAHDIVYGNVTINMANVSSNSTASLGCLSAIYGDLTINNGDADTVVEFDNLHNVFSVDINGAQSISFAMIDTLVDLSIDGFEDVALDGDGAFPNLLSLETFTFRGSSASNVVGFSNILTLEALTLQNNDLVNFDAFDNATRIFDLTIRNNTSLNYTSSLINLDETVILDIQGNNNLQEDGCDYYNMHTNLLLDNVQIPNWSLNSCDIDADGSLYGTDYNDQNPALEGLDLDNDGVSTCEEDCDDANPNAYPGANELWYNGVDEACDGGDDYDQDGDKDRNILFGGTDCDDSNMLINGLDLDGDGSSTCDGDASEPVYSCQDWLNYGFADDGIYPIYLTANNVKQVYCDMTTNGGGWTLFAVTNSSECAEDLPFGNNTLTDWNSAYFALSLKNMNHSEFLQVFHGNGTDVDYTIQWNFTGGVATLQNRFADSVNFGVGVNWDIDDFNTQYNLNGTWIFSDTGWNSFNSNPFNSNGGNSFSNDDGVWGAATGTINGNTTNPLAIDGWGHGTLNSNDPNSCGYYFEDGLQSYSATLVNLMYLR